MIELDVLGFGTWSPFFGDTEAFRQGMESGVWTEAPPLKPKLIAPGARRRMPKSVLMAIEVMAQACTMAEQEPTGVATVFSSAMGDMPITDYMCTTLAKMPGMVSPTKFHNSVHNAAPGYWSIATESFTPSTAVSAREFTASMAFLEAAIQAVEENIPVLLVMQEGESPDSLKSVFSSSASLSCSVLLAPPGLKLPAVASVQVETRTQKMARTRLPDGLPSELADNPASPVLRLLLQWVSAAGGDTGQEGGAISLPLNQAMSLFINSSTRATRSES